MKKEILKKQSNLSISSIVVHIILILLATVFIVPLVLPFLFAFKTPLEFAKSPWSIPEHFKIDNFILAWKSVQIGRGMINSFIVCAGAIAVTVPCAAMGGYIFSRYRNKVTDIIFFIVMGGFFVPVQMVLIPLSKISIKLHLINTLPGLFLPIATFGIPFWTMIFRSFFNNIPKELMESARIDGASNWRTFAFIMLPLAKPAVVLSVLLTFFAAWSDYILSLILINKQELFTVQLRVAQFIGNMGANFFPQYSAGLIIVAAPTIIIYIFLHKKIIEGATLGGALKG